MWTGATGLDPNAPSFTRSGEPTTTSASSSSSAPSTTTNSATMASHRSQTPPLPRPRVPTGSAQQSSGVWTYDASAFGRGSGSNGNSNNNSSTSSSTASSDSSGATTDPAALPSASELTRSHASSSLWGHPQGGNGVIGASYIHNHVSKSRLLWNHSAPEEEEREEEALPSYLSYLQPSFRTSSLTGERIERSVSGSSSGGAGVLGSGHPWMPDESATNVTTQRRSMLAPSPISTTTSSSTSHLHHLSSPFGGATLSSTTSTFNHGVVSSTSAVEIKTKELAFALQEFMRQQMETQQRALVSELTASGSPPGLTRAGTPPPPHLTNSTCECGPLKLRVSDLEQKLLVLQQQVSQLAGGGGSSAPALLHAHGMHSVQSTPHAPLQPPLPPGVPPPPPPTLAGSLHPPPPPPPPPQPAMHGLTGSPAAAAAAAANGVNDRVSTLEGRQSAFQSQLAQISKVLGVPIGKHGKNNQIKTLVQTLREEIDTKMSTVAKELETRQMTALTEEITTLVETTVEQSLRSETAKTTTAGGPPPPQLSYDTVLSALADEHEASLSRLSAYFDERLVQESKQRVGLESRVQARLGEQEEWLQQLEGEFGSWHDASSSVESQLRLVYNKLHELETTWQNEVAKWEAKWAMMTIPPATSTMTAQSVVAVSSSSSSGGGGTATVGSMETLTRHVQQLQAQHKQFQSEYKSETTELRENLALMETWVKTTRTESRDLGKSVKGMKQLVEKLVRDTGSAEELLQQYVSTITHQVASVTRQYVSVRIRDNNRLIDATLRARVPAYVENESESFMLVRPEKKTTSTESESDEGSSSGGVVLKDDDEEGMRRLLRGT